MTAETYSETSGSEFSVLGTFALFGLGILAMLVVATLHLGIALVDREVAAIEVPQVVIHEHAEKHAEAQGIRDCINNNGTSQIWRSFDQRTFFLLCQLPDGRWGFQAITQGLDKLWHEKTAFIKGNGTWKELIRYLEKLGTRFKGPYPW